MAALLVFIGNFWGTKLSASTVSGLTNSVLLFAFGVLSAAIGTAFTYCTQYCYTEEWKRTGIAFHIMTFLLVLAAFCLFGFGAYEADSGFSEHLSGHQLGSDPVNLLKSKRISEIHPPFNIPLMSKSFLNHLPRCS